MFCNIALLIIVFLTKHTEIRKYSNKPSLINYVSNIALLTIMFSNKAH
jgi:hypothetical protein